MSQEAERLAKSAAQYLRNGGLHACNVIVGSDQCIGHVIPQKVSGTKDFELSLRVRRPMRQCRVTVRQGEEVLKTATFPKANPAEMIQFEVPAEKMTAGKKIEVFVDEK